MLAEAMAKAPRAKVLCARCGSEASSEAWGHPLCVTCWGAWLRDARFSAGEVHKALGQSSTPEGYTDAAHRRYCDEATRRTAAWVREANRG